LVDVETKQASAMPTLWRTFIMM